MSSVDSLYDRCQLYVFQPVGAVTAGESVERVPKPMGRSEAMKMFIGGNESTLSPRKSFSPLSPPRETRVNSPLSNPSVARNPVTKSGVRSPASKRRQIFLFADDAAMAAYLVLIRCQLRVTGVTSVLLRAVVQEVLVGLNISTHVNHSVSQSSSDDGVGEETYIGGSPFNSPHRNFHSSENKKPSVSLLPKNLLNQMSTSSFATHDSIIELDTLGILGELSTEEFSSPSQERKSHSGSSISHRRCESPLCNLSRSRTDTARRYIKLDDWLHLCRQQPLFCAFMCEKLFALPPSSMSFLRQSNLTAVSPNNGADELTEIHRFDNDQSNSFYKPTQPSSKVFPNERQEKGKKSFNQYAAMNIRK